MFATTFTKCGIDFKVVTAMCKLLCLYILDFKVDKETNNITL